MPVRKLCAIDYEYNRSAEKDMGLISCAVAHENGEIIRWWLRTPSQKESHIKWLSAIKNTHILVGYAIQLAEARCVAALGLDPNEWEWRDLFSEWRWLRNETNEFKYGRVVKNGTALFTIPPARRMLKRMNDEEMTEAEEINSAHLEAVQAEMDDEIIAYGESDMSMLDCQYFFEQINLEQYKKASETKIRIRDNIIVKSTDSEIDAYQAQILEYNAADVFDLIPLANVITKHIKEIQALDHLLVVDGEILRQPVETNIQKTIGDWNSRLAKYANRGIPIDRDRLNTFLKIALELTDKIKHDWNREHADYPLYRIGLGETILEKRKQMLSQSPYINGEYTKDSMMLQKLIFDYCKITGIENWPKTRTGMYSTDKKALSTFASGENSIKQLERHQGQLSNLKSFSVGKDGKIEALQYIGSDNRQRPDFNPWGTQTARNAHKAKSLIFAMTHWLRVLVNPEPGMAIIELDYGSEEVFIGAAITGDDLMMAAYLSNDYYIAYAQMVGMYPKDLPIPTEKEREEAWFKPYKKVRSIAKTLCLSMQYGAGFKSVANAVAQATKERVDPDQGKEWVQDYRATYSNYTRLIDNLRSMYKSGIGIVLSNGWRLGKDSPSVLSASNLPVQGTGAIILQKACELMDFAQIPVIATMHDSITAYCKEEDANKIADQMKSCMLDASEMVLGIKGMKIGEPEIIRHGDFWAHGKGEADLPKYLHYFNK